MNTANEATHKPSVSEEEAVLNTTAQADSPQPDSPAEQHAANTTTESDLKESDTSGGQPSQDIAPETSASPASKEETPVANAEDNADITKVEDQPEAFDATSPAAAAPNADANANADSSMAEDKPEAVPAAAESNEDSMPEAPEAPQVPTVAQMPEATANGTPKNRKNTSDSGMISKAEAMMGGVDDESQGKKKRKAGIFSKLFNCLTCGLCRGSKKKLPKKKAEKKEENKVPLTMNSMPRANSVTLGGKSEANETSQAASVVDAGKPEAEQVDSQVNGMQNDTEGPAQSEEPEQQTMPSTAAPEFPEEETAAPAESQSQSEVAIENQEQQMPAQAEQQPTVTSQSAAEEEATAAEPFDRSQVEETQEPILQSDQPNVQLAAPEEQTGQNASDPQIPAENESAQSEEENADAANSAESDMKPTKTNSSSSSSRKSRKKRNSKSRRR